MQRKEALKLLQLPDDEFTATQVRAAFAARCKENHPDTGASQNVSIAQLKQARRALESSSGYVKNFTCKKCNGRGIIYRRLGKRSCDSCYGTGDE